MQNLHYRKSEKQTRCYFVIQISFQTFNSKFTFYLQQLNRSYEFAFFIRSGEMATNLLERSVPDKFGK